MPAILPIQDLDGKYRVECVRTVELPLSSIQEEAPLIEESDIEETVLLMPQAQTVKFFEHRHLRWVSCMLCIHWSRS